MDELQSSKPTDVNVRRLASYIPKLVQRRLVSNPQSIKVPEMEKFSACVMFADISGFTPLTEKFASEGSEGVEKLTAVLNDYFDKFIKIVYEYGGDIVKVYFKKKNNKTKEKKEKKNLFTLLEKINKNK